MKRLLYFSILFFGLITFASFFIWQGIYLPKDSNSEEQILFLIERGDGLREIAQNLEGEGIIKNKFFFEQYVFFKGKQGQLQAGGYFLDPSMNIPEIAGKIILGETAKIRVVIPEGFSLKQIEEKLVNLNVIRDSLSVLKAEDLKEEFGFLADLPADASLEGFLFPDTYYFAHGINVSDSAGQMLSNFAKKLDEDLREKIEAQKKSIFEIVIMASLLEKEVKISEDKKIVSGILWKRLKNRIPLQVDATITYITEKKTTKVLKEDLQIDSPYNTYKYLGLPIGPICNPGLGSIKAAIYLEDSSFWYYLSKPDGETIFSKTLEEHNIAKAKYLR